MTEHGAPAARNQGVARPFESARNRESAALKNITNAAPVGASQFSGSAAQVGGFEAVPGQKVGCAAASRGRALGAAAPKPSAWAPPQPGQLGAQFFSR